MNSGKSPNPPMEPDEEALLHLCQDAIRKIFSRNHWVFLIDEEEFTALVVAETQERLAGGVQKSEEEIAIDSTIYCYCRVWHFHCISEDEELRGHGYNLVTRYAESLVPPLLSHHGRGDLLNDFLFQQDVAQEITIKVARSITSITQPGAFLAYIKMVGVRTVKDLLAKKQLPLVEPHRKGDNENEYDDPLESIAVPEQINSVELNELEKELSEILERCLNSEAQRLVMKLYLLQEMKVREIAELLNLPVRQVSQYKSHALKRLKPCPPFIDFVDRLTTP